jgi:hypothetical protein
MLSFIDPVIVLSMFMLLFIFVIVCGLFCVTGNLCMILTVCVYIVYLYYPGGGRWYYINIFVPDPTPGTEFTTL